MIGGNAKYRVLIYSHDSFGLGHLRRCRAIAHSLVGRYQDVFVLILSGSPIIGSFDFRARVDFVRIPGVIKLRNGEYTSLGLHLNIDETLKMRASILLHTAEMFNPDLFLVDKEPLGLRGEVGETLRLLKRQGTRNVLGLRDVMDAPGKLRKEWQRKNSMPALEHLYDDVWVYGLEKMGDPLDGLDVPDAVLAKMTYTGYLRRTVPNENLSEEFADLPTPFVLVTAGGGGDGADIVDWVLRAYEYDRDLTCAALVVLGPFMSNKLQQDYRQRAANLDRVTTITFDSHIEFLMERAIGVVAMGGYNTFCEILSFDKRAVIVPRSRPREEQLIRAQRAEKLGLVKMLEGDGDRHPAAMAQAIRNLPNQALPSQANISGLLDGFDTINRLMAPLIQGREEILPRDI
ncbi:glycosyltransferase family protein [Pseudomonadota bacterium]